MESDETLLRSAQAGDVDALGELLSRHRATWIAAARWRGAREEDIEDIAQDVCEELIRALPTLDPESSLATNGRMRAVCRAIDLHRTWCSRERIRALPRSDDLHEQNVMPEVLGLLGEKEQGVRLCRIAERVLSPAQLEEFRRHEADPYAGTQALARQSPRSDNGAKAHWFRARGRLKIALAREGIIL